MRARRSLLALLALTPIVASACAARDPKPGGVVLLVGDGFGVSQLTLARVALQGKGGRLAMEGMPVLGLVSTWSASNAVTDSGAAATAFAAGVKTDNRYIGLDTEGRPVRSLGAIAREAGWRVGYVTTTRITHATPAAFYAHHDDRYDEDEIAAQLVAADVDLALGGGRALFVPAHAGGNRIDGRDLLAEARGAGWKVLERGAELAWDGQGRLLGLFAEGHLSYQLDDRRLPAERRDPSLATLARFALDALGGGRRPFFLLIEGGRIDQAGHDFDAAGVVAETRAFDEAIAAVLEWQRRRPDVLVLVTADHATGGLAINDYARWEDLARRTASVAWLGRQIRSAGAGADLVEEHTGYRLSAEEIERVRAERDSYEAHRRLGRAFAERDGFTWIPRISADDTFGHTGEDVPLFASGPGAERFRGLLDHTDIPHRLAQLTGLRLDPR
jgi:alkaline phosphatase